MEQEFTNKYHPDYCASRAILKALLSGRRLSQLDCREFGVEDMRTPVSHLKKRYGSTHDLKYEWHTTSINKARIKIYWLEPKAGIPCSTK